ncbi:hypothetical protein NEDG_02081 [Nematocida displodere]|uniref:Uncharacterized protein n=1 Tax=Nematocida displodere TaxID=1805483 RepID=A0A177EM26_9MICR|nr:hypothetical protein NEDG_02081 [Nematocida displodere]
MSWAGFLRFLGISSSAYNYSYPQSNYITYLKMKDVSFYNTYQSTYRIAYDHKNNVVRFINLESIQNNKKNINTVLSLKKLSAEYQYEILIKPRNRPASTTDKEQMYVCTSRSDYSVVPCARDAGSKKYSKEWSIKPLESGYKIKDAKSKYCMKRAGIDGNITLVSCNDTEKEQRFDMISVKYDPYRSMYLSPAENMFYEMQSLNEGEDGNGPFGDMEGMLGGMLGGGNSSPPQQHTRPGHGYGEDGYYPTAGNYPQFPPFGQGSGNATGSRLQSCYIGPGGYPVLANPNPHQGGGGPGWGGSGGWGRPNFNQNQNPNPVINLKDLGTNILKIKDIFKTLKNFCDETMAASGMCSPNSIHDLQSQMPNDEYKDRPEHRPEHRPKEQGRRKNRYPHKNYSDDRYGNNYASDESDYHRKKYIVRRHYIPKHRDDSYSTDNSHHASYSHKLPFHPHPEKRGHDSYTHRMDDY